MSQKTRALTLAILTVSALAAGAAMPQSGAAPDTPQPTPPRDTSAGQITSFYFGKNFQITPVPPINESGGASADAPGVSFPRFLLTNVGTWTVTLTEEKMVVEALDGLSIWASSDQGAQNVRFSILVEINGNSAGTVNTETKSSLSSSPEEFHIDAGSSRITAGEFPKGSQLSFTLQYRSSSAPLPAGPSKGSTFHYYGALYRSRLDIVTNPFNLTLSKLTMENSRLNVTEIVKDAFSVDAAQKQYFVTFSGPTSSLERYVRQVDTVFDPINGTTLIWNWDFATQGSVTSGAYAVTLSAQYVGAEANYTNVTSTDIKFPQVKGGGGGFLPGPGAAGVLVAVAAVAVAAQLVRAQRLKRL